MFRAERSETLIKLGIQNREFLMLIRVIGIAHRGNRRRAPAPAAGAAPAEVTVIASSILRFSLYPIHFGYIRIPI